MPHARGVIFARFRVTVVAVAAGAIVSVVVYLLTGGTVLQQKTTLYLYIPDATGVQAGTVVRVNGTAVGKVGTVQLSGSNQPNRIVRLTLRLEREHLRDIPVDSSAQISAETSVGDKYVDITQGRSPARVQPGNEIFYKTQPEVLKTLDLQQFAQRLRAMDATLTQIEQGRSLLGQLVVSRQTYDRLRTALADADSGFRDAISPTTAAGELLYTDKLYQKINEPMVRLDDQLARIEAGQGETGRLLREDGQYVRLRDQAAGLRQSIANLRTQPLFTSDDLYTSWNRAFGSLIKSVDQINTGGLFSSSAPYENLTGAAREMRDSVHDFRENPKKFLRIKIF